jgi:hypothetical protein
MTVSADTGDAQESLGTLIAWMIGNLDAHTKPRVVERLRATMIDHQTDRGVFYDSATWLIEARRH